MGVVVLYQMFGLMRGKEVGNSIFNEVVGQLVFLRFRSVFQSLWELQFRFDFFVGKFRKIWDLLYGGEIYQRRVIDYNFYEILGQLVYWLWIICFSGYWELQFIRFCGLVERIEWGNLVCGFMFLILIIFMKFVKYEDLCCCFLNLVLF